MTSNIGTSQLKDFGAGVGFGTSTRKQNENEMTKGVIEKALKRAFAPEFLNRIDDVILFNSLEKEHILKIIDLELEKLYLRVNDLGYEIKMTDKAKRFIADKGFDQKYGARPLSRAIQKYVEDPLAEQIINSEIEEGDAISIDLKGKEDKQEISVSVKKKAKADSTEDK